MLGERHLRLLDLRMPTVDFGTQRRVPKASAAFYSNVVRANAIPLLPATWPR